ncbi:MAG TPA: UDP-N-acetylglucosamine 2-epimerase [Syntrophales bacterium]|nr:UDP-N-acetylglucosamine 2-epimerase [Syntrophales bacterium]
MIHIMIGTKAQFIKMAPIMQELDRRAVRFNFIDSGQHAGITGDLLGPFGLRGPDVRLRDERTSITRLSEAIRWTAEGIGRSALRPGDIRRNVFRDEDGVCLIHGDTLTTLLSLLFAKRCGIKVAHVEAGLRSFNLLDPFPEEVIRLITMRHSDILFAPSEWAFENLKKMGYGKKTVHAGGNTIIDTLRFAGSRDGGERPAGPYVVVTIHRVETLYSRSRLAAIVALIERIGRDRKVLFVLHEPTQKKLSGLGLYEELENLPTVVLMPLQPYLTFVNLLAGADFIVTDGGSIQEESYYLNVPCLVMRTRTERPEGMGENACLAGFDGDRIDRFLNSFSAFRRRGSPFEGLSPSKTIVDHLMPYA